MGEGIVCMRLRHTITRGGARHADGAGPFDATATQTELADTSEVEELLPSAEEVLELVVARLMLIVLG